MPKLTHVSVVKSAMSANKAKDGKAHNAGKLIPALVATDATAKGFMTAVDNFLAACGGLMQGEAVTLVLPDGKTVTRKPSATPVEGKNVFPSNHLPTSYTDLLDAIQAGVNARHRNLTGAWLTANFSKDTDAASKSDSGSNLSEDDIA